MRRNFNKGPRGAYRAVRQQQRLDPGGWIQVNQAAAMLGVHRTTMFRWIAKHKLQKYFLGRNVYQKKTELAELIRSQNHGRPAGDDLVKWLMGEEQSGECSVCATPVPLSWDTCALCEVLE